MKLTRRAFGGAISAGAVLANASIQTAPGYRRERLHVPRYGPALCTDGERAFLSGGAPIGAGQTETHFHSPVLGLIDEIEPASLNHRFAANALFARANHASVWVNNELWLLGGRTRHGTEPRLLSETERITPSTQAIWRGPDLPVPLIHLSACTLGRSVFVFGGVFRDPAGGPSKASAQVWECSPPYEQWTPRTPMPVAIGNTATVALSGRVCLIGGYDQNHSQAIMQVFDPTADAWSLGPPPPIPLSAHAAAGSGTRLFTFGDYASQDSVLGLDTATGEWRTLEVPFVPRRHVRAVTISDRIIVAAGNQSSVAPATDVLEHYALSYLSALFESAENTG